MSKYFWKILTDWSFDHGAGSGNQFWIESFFIENPRVSVGHSGAKVFQSNEKKTEIKLNQLRTKNQNTTEFDSKVTSQRHGKSFRKKLTNDNSNIDQISLSHKAQPDEENLRAFRTYTQLNHNPVRQKTYSNNQKQEKKQQLNPIANGYDSIVQSLRSRVMTTATTLDQENLTDDGVEENDELEAQIDSEDHILYNEDVSMEFKHTTALPTVDQSTHRQFESYFPPLS